MDQAFWLARWEQGQTRFHRTEVSGALIANEQQFLGGGPHRVLVPLCGKSVDLPWLRSRGHDVVGVELTEVAVRALFETAGLTPTVTEVSPFLQFTVDHLTVWCGDVFALCPEHVGAIDRIWDRAALIALPADLRVRYAAHLRRLAPGAVMLLDTLEYDPAVMPGPPFTVPLSEVRALYGTDVTVLAERDVLGEEERWRIAGHQWMRTTTSTFVT